MSETWKPEGYNCATPYLLVGDPERLLRFLVAVFEATPLRRHAAPDGRIQHLEARIGDSVIMMGDPGDGSQGEAHVHVYVADVDAAFQRALAAGGTAVQAPVQRGDSDKRGGVTDPTGAVTWWISTQVPTA